jgi:hypothetical protein
MSGAPIFPTHPGLVTYLMLSTQSIKDNRKSYEDLALHVEQLLVAISTAMQQARPERLGAMTANVERLMKYVRFVAFSFVC